jgi:hypothetical protein
MGIKVRVEFLDIASDILDMTNAMDDSIIVGSIVWSLVWSLIVIRIEADIGEIVDKELIELTMKGE